jgi:hypothetical protein
MLLPRKTARQKVNRVVHDVMKTRRMTNLADDVMRTMRMTNLADDARRRTIGSRRTGPTGVR